MQISSVLIIILVTAQTSKLAVLTLSMMATTSKKSVLKKIIVYFSLFVKNALYFFVCGLYPGRPGGKNLSGSLDEQFSPKITKKKLHFVIAEIE
jgi:hypothetical protein